jgi:DNA-binding NarL/FixJ family response regulator
MGAQGLFARAEQPGAVTPLDTLTKAERAVAELVAEGLTSRQIAEQLFVSPRTVDAHLSHIFRKLEIASRAKLAALMAEVA